MRFVGAIALAISSLVFAAPAHAEKRVALVIGNSAYQNVSHLPNPTNDAAIMTATFRKASFDVVESRVDLSVTAMRRVLRDFADKARDADIAVVYYAGHGIEVDGMNYLIPVDAMLERDTDVYDETFALDRVLVAVEPARQLRLIILDACRDNPFARTMRRTVASRAIGRGLAKVEPSNPNTMIAFAAKAGFTAFDGDRKTSPFATALAEHLTKPGLDLRKAFGFVRDDVLKATNNKQEPFIYGSLGGNDVALVPAPAVVTAPAQPEFDPNASVRRDYELAERVGTKEAWEFFLSTYPNGFYAKLAQAQRNKLAAEEARIAATEKAKAAAEEQARLAAESAKAADQARAAALAKAAEEARLAAEKKKAQEDARLAEAERAKAAAQARAIEDARIAAEKAKKIEEDKANQARHAAEKKKAEEDAKAAEAERIKAAAQARAEEAARLAAEKAKRIEEDKAIAAAERIKAAALVKTEEDARAAAERAKAANEKKVAEAMPLDDKTAADRPVGPLAALTPPEAPGATIAKPPAAADIPHLLQAELRRVGCYNGALDGDWNAATRRSVGLFNKSAGTTVDTRIASIDALDIMRGKTARVCPLICEHGYRVDGDTCAKITCDAGFEVGEDNSCERVKSKKPAAKYESKPAERPALANLPPPAREPSFGGGGRCGATSCSQAVNGCMRRCSRNGVDCSHCGTQYNRCMQSGRFVGNVCNLSGLARN